MFEGVEVVGVAGEGNSICCEECNREERKGGIYSERFIYTTVYKYMNILHIKVVTTVAG